MRVWSFMVIAGDVSGDLLAAELVDGLRLAAAQLGSLPTTEAQPRRASLAPAFFGAGGPQLARAGVELALDLTRYSMIGYGDVFRRYLELRRIFHRLLDWAVERKPDVVIGVDYSGFNRRFAHALRQRVRAQQGPFTNWNPRLVQYVSPQVWASRPGRARAMARDYDLLLTIFPFEKEWYARHAPRLPVTYVGHPMVDRYASVPVPRPEAVASAPAEGAEAVPCVALLPGSRPAELKRHLPPVLGAARRIVEQHPARFCLVLPKPEMAEEAGRLADARWLRDERRVLEIRVGGLPEVLSRSTLALACTGTVTMECAWFGVPTLAFYKASWTTYQIGKRIIRVPFLAMPNLLAGECVFPELIQDNLTAETLAREALEWLRDRERRLRAVRTLARIRSELGPSGASRRAAEAVLELIA